MSLGFPNALTSISRLSPPANCPSYSRQLSNSTRITNPPVCGVARVSIACYCSISCKCWLMEAIYGCCLSVGVEVCLISPTVGVSLRVVPAAPLVVFSYIDDSLRTILALHGFWLLPLLKTDVTFPRLIGLGFKESLLSGKWMTLWKFKWRTLLGFLVKSE